MQKRSDIVSCNGTRTGRMVKSTISSTSAMLCKRSNRSIEMKSRSWRKEYTLAWSILRDTCESCKIWTRTCPVPVGPTHSWASEHWGTSHFLDTRAQDMIWARVDRETVSLRFSRAWTPRRMAGCKKAGRVMYCPRLAGVANQILTVPTSVTSVSLTESLKRTIHLASTVLREPKWARLRRARTPLLPVHSMRTAAPMAFNSLKPKENWKRHKMKSKIFKNR